jgi:type I restriction enzyme M protein
MLSVAENYIRQLNDKAQPKLFGQDWNDEAWAVCKADMLIKGEDADNIILDDTFTKDGFSHATNGEKWTFDYMLANPPFGVEWKQQQKFVENEATKLGHAGRFGAGTPRINDGAFLFLQHMISKMRPADKGGSRIGIVFNGSPLFTGDAGSGESEIRRWIIESDWLEAIVALPEQLFYNTGIATYVWIVTNRKPKKRKRKIQLLDARNFWVPMEKSLGNKRRRIGDPSEKPKDPDQIAEITRIYADFTDGDTRTLIIDGSEKKLVVSKVFDNDDFGYRKITVERPLRLNFQASKERIDRLDGQSGFRILAESKKKKNEKARQQEIEAGKKRQQEIKDLLAAFSKKHGATTLFKDREEFLILLRAVEKSKGVGLAAPELKAIIAALGERDETAEICRNKKGEPEPDSDLRDTETVPLKEDIDEYFKREVLPHVPDAWIDHSKTKVGYEIPLNRHFYRYEPPRPLEEIAAEIKGMEEDIIAMLREVTA